MKIFLLIIILQLLASCSSNTSNKEGKSFDANSSYCTQLRKDIFQANNDFHKLSKSNEEKHEIDMLSKVSSTMEERDRKIFLYEKDCESQAAYNARRKESDFKYKQDKSSTKN